MNIIKIILKKIAKFIHFVPATEEQKIEYAKRHSNRSRASLNETTINPASGLPMIGGLDVNGNSFGSNSSSDHYRRNQDDYYRSSSSNYNPINHDYWRNY